MKKSRNTLVVAMNKRHNSKTIHHDRRERRKNNPKRSWKEDM